MLSQAEFKAKVSAVCQQMGKIFSDSAVKVQTVLPAVQCKRRLVFLHGRFQPRHFLARYIRRVADQRVERADKARPSFSRVQPDCRYAVHKLQTLDIALGDGQRGARNIRQRYMGVRQLVRNGEANTAAAAAQIQHARCFPAAQNVKRKVGDAMVSSRGMSTSGVTSSEIP